VTDFFLYFCLSVFSLDSNNLEKEGRHAMRRLQIGVFGSATVETTPQYVLDLARDIGREIAKRGYICLTPACTGVGAAAAYGAKDEGGLTMGISPASGPYDDQYQTNYDNLDCITYTGLGYKGRNPVSVYSADAIVQLRGGSGSANEATIAFSEGVPIVFMEETGRFADHAMTLAEVLGPKGPVGTAKTAKEAVDKVLEMIED